MSEFQNEFGPSLEDMLENCDDPNSDNDEEYLNIPDAHEKNMNDNNDHIDDNKDIDIDIEPDDWKDYDEAKRLKEEGNNYYREHDYELAVETYTRAIASCPNISPSDLELLSTCYGNRGACYNSLGELDLVIEDCTQAIKYNKNYIKVIVRRYQTYEKLEKIDEALQDVKKIKEIDPSFPKIDNEIGRLTRLNDAKMEQMKNEALGKLKDLGNSILGNFGMSVDDFKFNQDPVTGGYSMSMGNQEK